MDATYGETTEAQHEVVQEARSDCGTSEEGQTRKSGMGQNEESRRHVGGRNS